MVGRMGSCYLVAVFSILYRCFVIVEIDSVIRFVFQPPKILDSILKLWEESQAENSRLRQDMTSMRQELEATKQQLEAAFQVCIKGFFC